MLKAIIRTVGFFGAIFAAGYVAQKYFGVDTRGLLDQAKDKLDDLRESSPTLKATLGETVESHRQEAV